MCSTFANTFQFQCGAIRSYIRYHQMSSPASFQFQCGAIRRTCLCLRFGQLFCFNSSVVRLEVKDLAIYLSGVKEFQFQCGAIRRFQRRVGHCKRCSFQFQCGAIRRSLTLW